VEREDYLGSAVKQKREYSSVEKCDPSPCCVPKVCLYRLYSPLVAFEQSDYNVLASGDSKFGIDRFCFRNRAIRFSGSSDSVFGIERSIFRDRAIPFSGSSDPRTLQADYTNATGELYKRYRRFLPTFCPSRDKQESRWFVSTNIMSREGLGRDVACRVSTAIRNHTASAVPSGIKCW